MEHQSTQVIIVGGGLVGLSAAMFLAQRGVKTVLVEQHASSSAHPRAIGFTPRTLELLRSVNFSFGAPSVHSSNPSPSPSSSSSSDDDDDDSSSSPPYHIRQVIYNERPRRARVESLCGKNMGESLWTPNANANNEAKKDVKKEESVPAHKAQEKVEFSPHTGAAIAQDVLEPMIRKKAIELGADIRQSTQMVRFEEDTDGVTVWVKHRKTGEEYSLKAPYMIGADGHRSKVREDLKIEMKGRGYMKTIRSALFRAPLQEYLKDGIIQFEIRQPDFEAFLTTYNDGRWVLLMDEKERTDDEYRECIYKALGRRDLEVELITTGCWELSARIADTFSTKRIFLAGDAAHTLPPSRGGYGANTGIEDVHNLSWKLQYVLNGTSSPQLLSTYDAERRPIGWLRHDQIFARPDYKQMAASEGKKDDIIEDDAMEFGQLYRSESVIGAGVELPPALRPDQWAGQPGTRAPHVPIVIHDSKLLAGVPSNVTKPSTLDLFQHDFILLSQSEQWKESVEQKLGAKVKFVQVGKDVEVETNGENVFEKSFGVAADGAVLIRPDGYIGWRYKGDNTGDKKENKQVLIDDALRQIAAIQGI